MNMFGWSTWGRIVPGEANEAYSHLGPMRLLKHHKGLIIAVPESMDRLDAFIAVAHMNEFLEDQAVMARSWEDEG